MFLEIFNKCNSDAGYKSDKIISALNKIEFEIF